MVLPSDIPKITEPIKCVPVEYTRRDTRSMKQRARKQKLESEGKD